MLGLLWADVWATLEPCWDKVGVNLRPFRSHFGTIFGIILRPCLGPFWVSASGRRLAHAVVAGTDRRAALCRGRHGHVRDTGKIGSSVWVIRCYSVDSERTRCGLRTQG